MSRINRELGPHRKPRPRSEPGRDTDGKTTGRAARPESRRRAIPGLAAITLIVASCASAAGGFGIDYQALGDPAPADPVPRDPDSLILWTAFPAWEKSRADHYDLDAPEDRCVLGTIRISRCDAGEVPPVRVIGRISMDGVSRPACDGGTTDCALHRPPDPEEIVGEFRTHAARHSGKGLVFTQFIVDYGPGRAVMPGAETRATVTAYVVSWRRTDTAWGAYCRDHPGFPVCVSSN